MRKTHTYAIGTFVRLISGNIVCISERLSASQTPEVKFGSVKGQPWYGGTDSQTLYHRFPENTITAVCRGFPSGLRTRQQLNAAPRGGERTIKRLTVSWSNVEGDAPDQGYKQEADKIVHFLTDVLPAGISDQVFFGLLKFAADDDTLSLLPSDVKPALRRWLSSGMTD